MTASPEIRAELSRLRTTLPEEGAGPAEPIRPETAIGGDAQRGIEECRAVIRDCEAGMTDLSAKKDRALVRLTRLEAVQYMMGVTYERD